MPPRPGLFWGPGCAKQLRRARIVDEQWIMTKTTTTFHVSWLAEKTPLKLDQHPMADAVWVPLSSSSSHSVLKLFFMSRKVFLCQTT